MKSEFFLVGYYDPKPWELEGRRGTSYKVCLRPKTSTEVITVSATEEIYRKTCKPENLDLLLNIEVTFDKEGKIKLV